MTAKPRTSASPSPTRTLRARRPQARADVSRQRILAAATTLFAGRGFDNVTIDEIAASASISRGSIFWHFRTKEDLRRCVIEDTILEFGRTGLQAEVGDRRGLAALEAALVAHRRLVHANPTIFRLHHLQMADALGPRADLAPSFVAMHRHVRALIRRWIVEAVDDGEIALPVDADAAAAAFLAAVSGLVGQWLLDPEGLDLDRAYRHLTTMILTSLGVDRPR